MKGGSYMNINTKLFETAEDFSRFCVEEYQTVSNLPKSIKSDILSSLAHQVSDDGWPHSKEVIGIIKVAMSAIPKLSQNIIIFVPEKIPEKDIYPYVIAYASEKYAIEQSHHKVIKIVAEQGSILIPLTACDNFRPDGSCAVLLDTSKIIKIKRKYYYE